ncbi:MAG: PD40 domain-containing protein, partial [Bacteroidota bacterium]|nr:PD40 domain-containing protein [Bacteroidota bacterium]
KLAGAFRKGTYEFAIHYAETHPDNGYIFKPENLGDSINSANLEYFPSITVDRKKLFFTRRISGNEDIYESDLSDDSVWGKAYPLPGLINTPTFNEGGQNISQDGKWLIFTGCNFPRGYGSCDLYISFLTPKGWSEPQNLGPEINTEFWESTPSLSPDKRDLYFSSNRPGGYGGKDIWVSHREPDGSWGPPENLGPQINTAGDESTPFIHADNQTLYFNSTGLPGYSNKPDLFVTHKLPNGKWSTPENLGYPINTIDDEGSLVVASDGTTAYYSSDRSDSKGGLDIYTFQLRKDIRPLRTLWVKGQVYDAKTHLGLPCTVELTDIQSGTVVSRLQTDEEGHYLVTLPVGKDYAFNVHRKGYLFYSQNYNLGTTNPDSTFTADIPLQPIEANAHIVLKNVFFDTKRTALNPESIAELDRVVALMQENPGIKIRITGYTDNVGKPADNLVLSKGRAISVVNYLLSKGIANDRLSFEGLGEANPVADNSSEEGRALNRRTELKIISVK